MFVIFTIFYNIFFRMICCFQVAGKHHLIYEAYYRQLDPKAVGTIEAVAAAKFLKKSGLSDVVLSRVSLIPHLNFRIQLIEMLRKKQKSKF